MNLKVLTFEIHDKRPLTNEFFHLRCATTHIKKHFLHPIGHVWGLSDRKVEEMSNKNLSVMCFLDIQLKYEVSDHSNLSRFSTFMVQSGAFDLFLKHINELPVAHKVVMKEDIQVDASTTDVPSKPKGKTTYQMAGDREESTVPPSEVEKFQSLGESAPLRSRAHFW